MDWLLPVARKGEVWREGRKILDRSLRPGSTMAYRQMMHENIRGFLARVLVTPKDFLDHIRLSVIVVLYILPSLTAMKPPGKTYHVPHVWI
jgi:cytochrome P450